MLDVLDSGLCHGVLKNHVGVFRLSDVETVPEEGTLLATTSARNRLGGKTRQQPAKRAKPKTVEELLQRLGLQVIDHLTRCVIFLICTYNHCLVITN